MKNNKKLIKRLEKLEVKFVEALNELELKVDQSINKFDKAYEELESIIASLES